MGIWEGIGSTAEAVKQNAPDATPVMNAFTYGGAAVTNKVYRLGQLIPDDETKSKIGTYTTKFAQNALHEVDDLYRSGKLMPDDETKAKIGTYATKFAQNAGHYAIQEGYKLIPGGAAISKIVSKTLDDVKYESLKMKDEVVASVEAKVSVGRAEKHGKGAIGSLPNDGLAAGKSPGDVIRVFMMKDLFVYRLLDGVMVSEIARKKGKKPE